MAMCHCVENWISRAKETAFTQARDNLQEALELFFETASAREVKQRLHNMGLRHSHIDDCQP
jgi:hypothetical protein